MQLLTKETDYAIRALVFLALKKDCFVGSSKISKSEKIPYQFLRRILQVLCKKNFIESKEGIAGGVRLKVNPKNIAVTDLIRIFQGNIELSSCMFRMQLCEKRSRCVLRKKIKKIERVVIKEFKNITIESLINDINMAKRAKRRKR